MNVTWASAREVAPKQQDTWVRVLLLNWWATPLTYLVARYTMITPTLLTLLSLVAGLYSAYLFWSGGLIGGASTYFAHFVLDGMDGKLSRILGHEDSRRGSLDLICDGAVFVAVMLGLGWYALNTDEVILWLLMGWMGLHFMDMRLASLVYKLRSDMGMSSEWLVSESTLDQYGSSTQIRTYMWAKKRLSRWRLNVIPTVGEGAFLAFIIGPIVWELTGEYGWESWAIALAILCTLPGTLGFAHLAHKLSIIKHERNNP